MSVVSVPAASPPFTAVDANVAVKLGGILRKRLSKTSYSYITYPLRWIHGSSLAAAMPDICIIYIPWVLVFVGSHPISHYLREPECSEELPPEGVADEAVDGKVARGVEHHEGVRDKRHHLAPIRRQPRAASEREGHVDDSYRVGTQYLSPERERN